jgi:protein-tyrosine-phosphatase
VHFVFVCTGNSFRSPLAAAYLRRLLVGINVTISTCGIVTATRPGHPPLPEAVELAASSGIDLSGHRTRFVEDVDLDGADLVIGFEDAHLTAAVVAGGSAPSRTFDLGELVGLLRDVDVPPYSREERARALIARANDLRMNRGDSQPIRGLPDPYGRSRRFHVRTARELRRLTIDLAALLFPDVEPAAAILPCPRLQRRFGHRR